MQAEDCEFFQTEKDYILFLVHTNGVGRRTIQKFIKFLIKHEDRKRNFWVVVSDFFDKSTRIKKVYKKATKSNFENKIYSIKLSLKKNNIRVVYFFDSKYPKLLFEADDYPIVLFFKGSLSTLSTSSLAMVGTRKMTAYGRRVVSALVPALVSSGFTIVSGAMYGVDIASHKKTLEQQGKTVAVLGYGFFHIPEYAKHLLEEIVLHGGCVLTEYPPTTRATTGTFPERNRIVAGLSQGVLVIEAAQKSGTHITVDCALDAGREVFAVPGSIFSPYSEGTKTLLQKGAILVSSAKDIFTELTPSIIMPEFQSTIGAKKSDSESYLESEILIELKHAPRSTSELATKLELEIPELLVHLSMLELKSKIVKDADYWQLVIS